MVFDMEHDYLYQGSSLNFSSPQELESLLKFRFKKTITNLNINKNSEPGTTNHIIMFCIAYLSSLETWQIEIVKL